ncbi:MAG: sugar kinase [Deltaproteobacteria bacterium]|nr:sugar kinase [Deltaproteobacteria bacterium]
MTVLVVGSVALDTIEAPAGRREMILGGAANYFSLAAAHFTPVQLVAVVGDDFPDAHLAALEGRGISTAGLQRAPGKTFHWAGRYGDNCNERETLATDLNVFASFKPVLPEAYRETRHVFLANIHPQLQLDVLDQVRAPGFVAADTMNFWISGELPLLRRVLQRIDALFINEGEARQLAGEHNLVAAARAIAAMGPQTVVVKLGAFGAMLWVRGELRLVPAFPLASVVDPTGAGDSFGGGFAGTIAAVDRLDAATLHRAAAVGAVLGAFCCEGFGVERLLALTRSEIEQRLSQLRELVAF